MFSTITFAQAKLAITISNPSNLTICQESDFLKIDVRNITTSTVTGIETSVELPFGMEYIKGSLSGNGISEKNTSDLNKPVFSVDDLAITKSAIIEIKIKPSCSTGSYISSGGLAVIKTTTLYAGGSINKNSSPLNIKQPSLQIQSISNQLKTADIGEVFVREIVLKNNGAGNIKNFAFRRIYPKGLKLKGVSGGIVSSNGDTTWSLIDSATLVKHGNKDRFFDLKETITLTDTIEVLSCQNLTVNYLTYWGCDKVWCKAISSAANVIISAKAPILTITPVATFTRCFDPSVSQTQQLRIVNTGTDTARSVSLDVFQALNTGFNANVLSEILASSFQYSFNSSNKISVTPDSKQTTNTTGKFSCLSTNATGSVTLSLPNMAAGDTILLEWKSKTCCTELCGAGTTWSQRWKYSATYKDQCDKTLTYTERWGSGGIYQGMTFTKVIPKDLAPGQKRLLEYTITNGYFFSPITSSQTQIELILGKGISHSKIASDLKFVHPNGTSWTPNYFKKNGDTITAVFYGTPKVTLQRSELRIYISADCNSSSTNSNVDFKLNIKFNPDTLCSQNCFSPVICQTEVFKVHCSTCKDGLHFNNFEVERTNFGKPDNNNDGIADASGSLDFDNIKINRAMFGDTIKATMRGKVYNSGSITSWRFGGATSTLNLGRFVSVADVRIKVFRRGAPLINCSGLSYTETALNYWAKKVTVDIGYSNLVTSGCGSLSLFNYTNSDSIELEILYVVTQNPGNSSYNLDFQNELYLSTVANPSNSQKYQCDTFGGSISLIGSFYTSWNSNEFTVNGCDPFGTYQNYYLSIGRCCTNYAGGNIFPSEYRPFSKLNGILIKKNEGFDFNYANLRQYRTAGTGGIANQFIDTIKSITKVGNNLFLKTDSLYEDVGGPLLISDDGFLGTLRLNLTPNCKAEDGTTDLEYGFVFEGLGPLKGNFDTINYSNANDRIKYNAPDLLVVASNTNEYAESDTLSWNIKVANNSASSNAENLWFGLDDTSNIRLVSIYNVTDSYELTKGSDLFKFGDISSLNLKEIIVKAVYKNCGRDSVNLIFGYDCAEYPSSASLSKCGSSSYKLYYETVNTRLEAFILDTFSTVNLCEENEYRIRINNTGKPKVYNTYVDLALRPGMILGDTAYVFVNGRSDSIRLINPEQRPGNVYRWVISTADSTLKNYGLNGVSSATGYGMELRFKLNTDCDFTSATYFLVKPGGNLRCGTPVLSPYTVGEEINIENVSKPYFASLDFHINPLDACNYSDSTRISFINLGPDTTANTDFVKISFPRGITADTSSLTAVHNAPTLKASLDTSAGDNSYSWKIPSGIKAGDSCTFYISTSVNPQLLDCGINQIYAQTVVSQPVICVADSSSCNIDVATSSVLVNDSIKKGIYSLEFAGATSVSLGNNEDVSLSYKVYNSGVTKETNDPLIVDVYYDANNNGVVDASDNYIVSDTIFSEVASLRSISKQFDFEVESSKTCNLILFIGDKNCLCEETSVSITTISLRNAGNDTIACPKTPFNIGLPGNKELTYSWNNTQFVNNQDSSKTLFTGTNNDNQNTIVEMVLSTDKGSCSSTDTVLITLYPQMQFDMADSVKICDGDSIIIGSQVFGGVGILKTQFWTPSTGLARPTRLKTWAKPSADETYTITITDDAGCRIQDSVFVNSIPNPIANFSVTDTCTDALFRFFNTSNYPESALDSIAWQLDTFAFTNVENPVFFFPNEQTLDISIFISNSEGCTNQLTKQVEVYSVPTVSILSYSDCEYDTTTLSAIARVGSGTLTYNWLVDGANFTSPSITAQLGEQTELISEVTVTSDKGCTATAKDTSIVLDKPEIISEIDNNCFDQLSVLKAIEQAQSIDSIVSYNWFIDNGQTASGKRANLLVSDTGTYAVELIVQNIHGCSDTAMNSFTIHPLPKSSFTATSACLGDTIRVEDISTSASNIASIEWDTGNGYFVGDSILKIIPTTHGTYTIHQKVTTIYSCKDSSSQTADAFYIETPQFNYTGNCQFSDITFNAVLNEPDSIARIKWLIDNDSSFNSTFSRTFSSDGDFTLLYDIETNKGCKLDTQATIHIDPKPLAAITNLLICNDNKVEFKSNYAASQWGLGDGSSSLLDSFVHTYSSIGDFNISLFVSNSFNCKDTIDKVVTIPTMVYPDFEIKDTCENAEQVILETTLGNLDPVTSILFKLGNGETKNAQRFPYAYPNPGTYTVELTVTTLPGCSYDTTKTITIHPNPIAGFRFFPDDLDVFDAEIEVRDESSGAQEVMYAISSGDTYSQRDFIHRFRDSGNYVIKQWIKSAEGCFDSTQKAIYISYAYKLFIPNSFTPNQDGLNEEFKPVGLGLVEYDMWIYNRWGELVFRSEDTKQAWTGENALEGYYMYIIKARDFENRVHNYKGTVLLLH